MKEVIGYLVVDTKSDRTDNVGGDVVKRVLQRAGYDVVDCDPGNIDNYRLVLLSIPSTYQIIDILRAAIKYGWLNRKCKILVGGFGCQNISAISDYVDFAYYGRAHVDIASVVQDILITGRTDNKHVLTMAFPRPTVVNTAAPLFSDNVLAESFTGCRNMCKFCHYAHVRSLQGTAGSGYVQSLLTSGNSPEVLLKDIVKMTDKPGRIRTAIDGFSERLRFLFGKKIHNNDIVNAINHLGSLKESRLAIQLNLFGGKEIVGKKETVVAMVYNIGSFPTETEYDERELEITIGQCNPRERVIFIVHTTPFRPSLLTPMQWAPVRLFPEWSGKREHVICDKPTLLSKYSYTLEGAFSHACSVVIDRYGIYGDDQRILDAILHAKGGRSFDKAVYLLDNGAQKYLEELPVNVDPLPYVSLPPGKQHLRRMGEKLSEKYQSGYD